MVDYTFDSVLTYSKDRTTYLVTGSHGNIGSYIVEELCRQKDNINIICVDSLYNGNVENLYESLTLAEGKNIFIKPVLTSIDNEKTMRETFADFKPDYVFHCASMLTLDSKEKPIQAIKTNTLGAGIVFQLSVEHDVKKVIYSSSASVFGQPAYTPTDENCPLNGDKLLYGSTKIATEFIARTFIEEGLNIVGLRYFNVYGPRQSLANVYTQIVPKWIRSIAKGEDITIYGDGSQTMDMIFSTDVARSNLAACENDECRNIFINIGTSIQTSVKDLLDIMLIEMGKLVPNIKSEITYESHDPNLVKKRCCDNKLMVKYLGKPQTDLQQGIAKTCAAIYNRMQKNEVHND
tara:strand:- start:4097 stop:5143 length:1047 start_codon:yes stop_codon:yes gene_type:complete